METNELGFHFNLDFLRHRLIELQRQVAEVQKTIDLLKTLPREEQIRYLNIDIRCFPDIPVPTKNSLMRYARLHHLDTVTASSIYIMGRNKVRRLSEIEETDIKDLDVFFTNHGYTWHD